MFMFIREFIHTFVVLEVEVEDHGLVVVHGRPQAVLDEGLPDDCVFLRGEKVRQRSRVLCKVEGRPAKLTSAETQSGRSARRPVDTHSSILPEGDSQCFQASASFGYMMSMKLSIYTIAAVAQ